jgi:hypothetical protein
MEGAHAELRRSQIAVRVSRRQRPASDDLDAAKAMAEALIAFIDEVRRLGAERVTNRATRLRRTLRRGVPIEVDGN